MTYNLSAILAKALTYVTVESLTEALDRRKAWLANPPRPNT